MSSRAAVTVVMPAYNAGRFIAAAIDSVVTQSFPDWRLLVIDDASSDDTSSVLSQYRDIRIHVTRLPRRGGVAAARNHALNHVDTPYVAFLDADDVAEPDRLRVQIDRLEADHVDLIASRITVVDEAGEATGASWGHEGDSNEIPAAMLFSNCLATSSIVLRHELIARERFDPALNPVDDYGMWCRLIDRGRVACLPERLIRYRVHGASLLHTHSSESERGVRQILSARLARMGVEATLAELDIHRGLATATLAVSPDVVAASEQWLARLDRANDVSGVYPDAMFRRVLGRYWLDVCQLAVRSASTDAWRRVLRSHLTPRLLADGEGRRGLANLAWRAACGAARSLAG